MVIQALMKSCLVVVVEVGVYSCLQLSHCFIAFKVDILVLEAPPQTLDSYIVQSTVPAVHADFYVVVFQYFLEDLRRKLDSLISVENCRTAELVDCLLQKPCILAGVHCIEQLPFQNFPAVPVDYCHKINVAGRKSDVCYIR